MICFHQFTKISIGNKMFNLNRIRFQIRKKRNADPAKIRPRVLSDSDLSCSPEGSVLTAGQAGAHLQEHHQLPRQQTAAQNTEMLLLLLQVHKVRPEAVLRQRDQASFGRQDLTPPQLSAAQLWR